MGRILEDEEEDDQFGDKASEPKVEFDDMGKMHPLILDVKTSILERYRHSILYQTS